MARTPMAMTLLAADNTKSMVLVQIGNLVQIGDQLYLTLTLSPTLPDRNLSIFPSIPCLVSGRRSEPIIILLNLTGLCFLLPIRFLRYFSVKKNIFRQAKM